MTQSGLRQRLGARLAAHPRAWWLYRRLRQRLLSESPAPGPIHQVLTMLSRERPDVHFVQVGSCDAGYGDPIVGFVREHGWRGVMVEPVPHVFALLRARHGSNPRLTLQNVAIGDCDGERPFYCLEPLADPPSPYYNQLGSFSRAHIENHERFFPGVSKHIREIKVPCLRLCSLLQKQGISELDLLHVDAEGADFEVLQTLDFTAVAPRLLLFELGHLPRAQREACAIFLEQRGYRLLHEGRDCLALHAAARARWPKTALAFDAHSPEP